MAIRREYLDFVMGQIDGLDGVEWRAVMGESIRYDRGRTVSGIDDACPLVKLARAAAAGRAARMSLRRCEGSAAGGGMDGHDTPAKLFRTL